MLITCIHSDHAFLSFMQSFITNRAILAGLVFGPMLAHELLKIDELFVPFFLLVLARCLVLGGLSLLGRPGTTAARTHAHVPVQTGREAEHLLE